MHRKLASPRFWALGLFFALVFAMVAFPATRADEGTPPVRAQGIPFDGLAAASTQSETGSLVASKWSADMPQPSAAQIASAERGAAAINRPTGDIPASGDSITGPSSPQSESRPARAVDSNISPQDDFTTFRSVGIPSTIVPANRKSNVMETNVDGSGRYLFASGNWFAARSTNNGVTWAYVDPFTLADFCCDQVVIYDKARSMLLWLRMTVRQSGNTFLENQYTIGVSLDEGATFCHRSFTPSQTGDAGSWYDYPHWDLTTRNLWLTTNQFNSAGNYNETKILRIGLDTLHDTACSSGIGYQFWDQTNGTVTPASGAKDTMYFANHVNTSTVRVLYATDTGNLFAVDRSLGFTWAAANRNTAPAICTSSKTNTNNWGGRTDSRPLAVVRQEIGGEFYLSIFWNARQGGNFPWAYIEAVRIRLSNWTVNGRPYVWNSSGCFLYPAAAANERGDVGMVLNYGVNKPSIYAAIDDEVNGVPPGWEVKLIATGQAAPTDSKWGDYNGARPYAPAGMAWIGSSHYFASTSGSQGQATPQVFIFGRYRDRPSWVRYFNK